MTASEEMARYLFALNNINNDFRNCVFADETSLQTKRFSTYHNRIPSSQPRASAYKPRTVESVQVWRSISYYGLTPIVTFNQYLTRHGYEVIIKEYLAPFISDYQGGCSLIQDNDSKHTSNISKDAIRDCNIRWVISVVCYFSLFKYK